MRSMMAKVTRETVGVLVLCALVAGATARAQGTTNPATGYAWSETVGWINFAPQHGGVTVTENGNDSYLSGYAWAENVGWIKMGADGVGPYANSSPTDWGVNMDAAGTMSGYAWSETMGWVNFGDANGPAVAMNTGTGEFNNYAWAENAGWVHFKDALYGVLRSGGTPSGTVPTLGEWGIIALVLALGYAARRRLAQMRGQTA